MANCVKCKVEMLRRGRPLEGCHHVVRRVNVPYNLYKQYKYPVKLGAIAPIKGYRYTGSDVWMKSDDTMIRLLVEYNPGHGSLTERKEENPTTTNGFTIYPVILESYFHVSHPSFMGWSEGVVVSKRWRPVGYVQDQVVLEAVKSVKIAQLEEQFGSKGYTCRFVTIGRVEDNPLVRELYEMDLSNS